jgi:hypothetical protein
MGDTAISSLSFEFFSPGSRARGADSSIASPINDSKLSPNCCLGRTCLKWGGQMASYPLWINSWYCSVWL